MSATRDSADRQVSWSRRRRLVDMRETAAGTVRRSPRAWGPILSVVLIASIGANNAGATPPGSNGRIAFVSARSGWYDIWVRSDTDPMVRVTFGDGGNFSPSWSPSGSGIAFSRSPTGGVGTPGIWVVEDDGSDLRRIADGGHEPSWSPDGSVIAFEDAGDLWAVELGGGSPQRLTSGPRWDAFPAWSPDGRYIAFEGGRFAEGEQGIYKLDVPTGHTARLTVADPHDTSPSWSPDGSEIAFVRETGGARPDIFSMKSDGSNPKRLTNHSASDLDPVWSPDGTQIAFVSARDGNFEIYRMNRDGSQQLNLTAHPLDDIHPNWEAVNTPQLGTYVALGDSFSSGDGAPDTTSSLSPYEGGTDVPGVNMCRRSAEAYSRIFARDANVPVTVFRACSGATVDDLDVGSHHIGEPAQIVWLSPSTRLVTLTIGGNDVHFGEIMENCFALTPSCKQHYTDSGEDEVSGWISAFAPTLASVYGKLRGAAPNARFVVLGYPGLFQASNKACVDDTGRMGPEDIEWLSARLKELNAMIAVVVRSLDDDGFSFLSTQDAFAGHELCTADAWINSPGDAFADGTRTAFHPDSRGQARLAQYLASATQ